MDDKNNEVESRVIVVKNIPHGFYEKQMMDFFGQFGAVTRLRLLRSKKYLNSKGIAFVEFAYEDVAKIAAHTMNNYLMFEKLIKCELVPKKRLPKGVFRGWKSKKISTIIRHKSISGRIREDFEWNKLKAKKLKSINDTTKKLKDLGIEYQCVIAKEEEIEESNSTAFLSMNGTEVSCDESFVTCDSSMTSVKSPKSSKSLQSLKLPKLPVASPITKKLNSLTDTKLSFSNSVMKRKISSLPKFAILHFANKRLSF